ncbi:MAG TPA: DUF1801 domain-containing protein [bacterium]|nr:DUF1801 domain-containing protein [bacterium]
MAQPKTQPTSQSVTEFLNAIPREQRRLDCFALVDLMRDVTGAEACMWGPAIVGFGTYTYEYASGQTGDWPLLGFSPRRQNLTVYLTPGFERSTDLMARLGRYKTAKSCLYLNRLADVDTSVLRELLV